jgi:hypothetical protein
MTRIIKLKKRETTHIQDLKLIIQREKLEILKVISEYTTKNSGVTYEELVKKYYNAY